MNLLNFFAKYKKPILIIGFVLISIFLGYVNYVLFLKPSKPLLKQYTEKETKPSAEGFPSSKTGSGQIVDQGEKKKLPLEKETLPPQETSDVAQGGLTKTTELNQVPSLGAALSDNGSDLQYYDKTDGKFYSIDKDGSAQPLSDKVFHNVSDITWSPKSDKAILEYPDGSNIIYNFKTKRQVTLPKHWKEFDFSPNGNEIVMKSMGLDPDNRWLAVSSDNGSKTRPIEHLGTKDATVYPSWSPNNQIVAMFTEGRSFDRQELYFVGLNHENFKSTIIEGRGFEPKWSKDGDRLLYSVYSSRNNLKPNLWIVNAQGENIGGSRKNLNLETWANKCVFTDNAGAYCAVPSNLEEGAGLFPELAESATDRLYKIDTRTGLKKLIAVPDGDFNMSNLIVSKDGYYLYFTDKKTKKLHKIKLKQ